MPSFVSPRDRDAWSTIRGYIYQVDLTIQRWLNLASHQILEIECGEDIDIVGRSLVTNSEERDRLLEQVKHRDSSLTLRKPEAIAAIANFIEHCEANPFSEIVFQFTTNAKIGREQQSPIPNRIPAIESWEKLRLGEQEEASRDKVIAGIHQILRSASKPDGLHTDTWQRFCNFIQTATDEQFLTLIRKFQWRTNAPEAQSLKSIIQQQLVDHQYAIDLLQAQEQYQRLFWYVFSRLREQGRKRLTLEELNTQLTLPSLNSSDHETLETLKTWFYEIDNRIIHLEQGQQQNNQLLDVLSAKIQQLIKEQGINGTINYVVKAPILDVYPLAERSSLREETIQALAQTFEKYTWIAIDGSLGSGKTQLAVLLVHYLTSQGRCANCICIRLRDSTVEQACFDFDQAVTALVGSSSNGNFSAWYSQLSDRLEPNTIVIFDDLPQLARGDELEARLIQLAQICHSKDIRLLSTSFHQLPQNLRSILGSHILYTMQVPLFTNNEAMDLFIAYDAPASFLNSNWVPLLNGLANYHPSLLAAIAEYLHRRNWQFTSSAFDALLRGDHTIGVNEETLSRILIAIQDDQSQELLYRLNLVAGFFSTEDMQALAEIAPRVERPRQRLNGLLGAWIQRDVNNRLRVSPLVKALGSQDLATSVYQECHLTLGERIAHSELDQYKAFQAISHFAAAEAFEKAGTLLLYALFRLEGSKPQTDDAGILLYWSHQPLPEQMNLGIRLLIRGFQISAGVKRNQSIIYFLDDLDNLVQQVTEQESGMLITLVAHISSKYSSAIGFSRLNQYLQTALCFSPVARLHDGTELFLKQQVPFESLIWTTASIIQSTQELEEWLITLQQLTSEQREQAFSTRVAEAGCLAIPDQIWLQEARKPKIEQNWLSALAVSNKLVETASNLGLELLWACAVRSKAVILGDYQRDLPQASELIESAIAQASDDSRIQFLLKEILGRSFIESNHYDEAVFWLTKALEQSTEAFPLIRLRALLKLSYLIATQEPYLSIQYAQQAVNLAQSSQEIPADELVKALGELAIAKWMTIDLPTAFDIWDQAGECLLKYRNDIDVWKELFVLYAHFTSYFTAIATTGSPLNNIENSETLMAPARGIFLTQNSARVNYYNPSRDCFLLDQLASLAEAIGNDERALAWSMRGIEMAREAQQFLPLTSMNRNVIPQLVLENRYAEALDLAVESGRLIVALPLLAQSGRNILEPELDIQAFLSSSGSQIWEYTESCAMLFGAIPIIFHIANLAIRQPELVQRQAIELSAICRQISDLSSSQSLWTIAAEIIDQINLQQSTCVELISQYRNLSFPLNVLGFMAATLQENAPLLEVLRLHLSIIDQVRNLTGSQSAIYRRITLPYLFNYWIRAVEQVTFRFNNPQLAANMLFQARELPVEQQGQAIVDIIQSTLIM